jgi:galactitol-specific phosphotransferase system IIC component
MMPSLPDLPRELRSNQVLIRFGLRIAILAGFAAFSHVGFGKSLAALLLMTAILCAVTGTIRRETPLDKALNYWDETLAYAALYCMVNGIWLSAV